jgi:hypothetical protein
MRLHARIIALARSAALAASNTPASSIRARSILKPPTRERSV